MTELKLSTIKECTPAVLQSFEKLPNDAFLKEEHIFRQRRYSAGQITEYGVEWALAKEAFYQSEKLNGYCGGMRRDYEPIEPEIKNYISEVLVPAAIWYLPQAKYSLGVHQIRVLAENDKPGKPAPEGIHQDGFDFVMTACMHTNNVVGGNSIVVDNQNRQKIIYDKVLQPCEFLLFDDRIHAHYVSPIIPRLPGNGFRDVFVLTFKAS